MVHIAEKDHRIAYFELSCDSFMIQGTPIGPPEVTLGNYDGGAVFLGRFRQCLFPDH